MDLTRRALLLSAGALAVTPTFGLAGASKALGGVFTHSGIFAAAVPTYAGGVMAFGWGSEAVDAANPAMHATPKYAALGDLRYYTLEVHRAAFALPKYVQGLAGGPPRS